MRLTLGITTKLTLAMVAVSLVPLALLGGVAYVDGRTALHEAAVSDLQSTALEKQAALQRWIYEAEAEVTLIAADPDLASLAAKGHPPAAAANAAAGQLAAYLHNWASSATGSLESLSLIEPERGEVIASTEPAEVGTFKADRPYFLNGLQATYVQSPDYDPAHEGYAMTVATPVHAAGGGVAGVLAANLNLSDMNDIVSLRSGLHQTDDAYLVNTASQFVTQPRFLTDPAVLRSGEQTEAVQRCLTENSGVVSGLDYRGAAVLSVYRWLPEKRLCLVVEMDQDEVLGPAHRLGAVLLFAGALAVAASWALSVVLAHTITAPTLMLAAAARAIGDGNLDYPINVRSRDEIGQLERSFQEMARALRAATGKERTWALELEQRVAQRTAELRHSQEQYYSLFSNAQVGMYRATLDGATILDVNQKLADLFGWSIEEMRAQPATMRWADPAAAAEMERRLQDDGYLDGYEMDAVTKSGDVRRLLLAARQYPGEGFREGSAIDITDRQQLFQRLEESNRDLREFTYVASHDLQEPLRKIMAFGDLLKTKYNGVLDETGIDYLQRMNAASQRMQTLIISLLTYSRVATRGEALAPVDLNVTMEEVLSDLEQRMTQSGATVEVGRLATIEANATQMYQLLQNLINNALKFQPAGQRPVVKVWGVASGNEYQIFIKDNGIGFDVAYRDRIFKPFQRLHTRDEYEGSGMGLAICRRIVERHGGTITAASSPGAGSTFVVCLPMHYHRSAPEGERHHDA